MRRPKLVVVTTVPETLATILKGQPRRLAASFDVVLISSHGDELLAVSEREGVSGIPVDMARGISILQDVFSILRMVWVLARLKPDIVHSYTPKAGLVSMLGSWICRVPVRVHTFTGLIFPTATDVKQKVLIWIDRLICACATHVVPEGNGVKKDLERFSITSKPLDVIGYGNIAGVNTSYFSPQKVNACALLENLGVPREDFVFCFVGRLNRDKGVAELVEAFQEMPENSHLILVGAEDNTAPVPVETMNLIEASPRIHMLGFLDDIRPVLAFSDVLVLPSYREGFPNAILQAGAMQLPVIATDVNGSNEVIENGLNGWLVPAKTVEPLRAAMHMVMSLPRDELVEVGSSARNRIQKRFEQADHWERMENFYSFILGRAKGSVE